MNDISNWFLLIAAMLIWLATMKMYLIREKQIDKEQELNNRSKNKYNDGF